MSHHNTPPQAVILAAGLGTRMRPLTDATPKPLLPFLNTPLIAYTLDHIARAGARRVGVNTCHLAHLLPPVVEPLANALGQLQLAWAHEPHVSGTGGGLLRAWQALGRPDAPLLVLNGDAIFNADLRRALQQHRDSNALLTLLTRPLTPGHPGGVFTDPEGRITGFRKTHHAPHTHERAYMGVHIVEPALLERLERAVAHLPGVQDLIDTCWLPALLDGDHLHTLLLDDFWVAMDTPALLLDATRRALLQPDLFHQSPFRPTHAPGLALLHPDSIHGAARLAPPVFAGLGAQLDAGARVGPCVTLDGTHVGTNASIQNAILFGMGRVEGRWEGCVAVAGQIAQVHLS